MGPKMRIAGPMPVWLSDYLRRWHDNAFRSAKLVHDEAHSWTTVETEQDQTGSSKVKPLARRTLPQLPIEVWEKVIDHLWDDQWTLEQCSLVCRAWYPPSRFHLDGWIRISSIWDVRAYAKMLKQTPELSKRTHDMSFREWGGASNYPALDLAPLLLAAILLARKLPWLEQLAIRGSVWIPWMMHKDIFLHLSGFSITRLDLAYVAFPSITVFGRLVCALPRLVELNCEELIFFRNHVRLDAFAPYHDRVKVRSLSLRFQQAPEKLIDFLAHPCISSHLQRLIFDAPVQEVLPQYIWRCLQLLDAASGSLLELQLYLRTSQLETGTEVSIAALVPPFTDHASTSLRRLWLVFDNLSRDSYLDTLRQVLCVIQSGQLREIVLVFYWRPDSIGINRLRAEVKKLHEPARHEEIDNYLSSDSLKMLSKVEFSLIRWRMRSKDDIAAFTAVEELWKQNIPPLFPLLTKRGIFCATIQEDRYEDNF